MASNAAAAGAKTYFTTLSLELLRNIAGGLGLWDRLKLRTVFSKSEEETVVDLIGDALKTVYLSPTKDSVVRFVGLCRSTFFQKHITSVVFLPGSTGALYSEFPRDFDTFRRAYCKSLNARDAQSAFDVFWKLRKEHRAYTDFRNEDVAGGVSALVKLSSISVQHRIQCEGINADAWYYSNEYAQERERSGLFTLEPVLKRHLLSIAGAGQWRGTLSLLTAVEASQQNIRTLSLGDRAYPLPFNLQDGPMLAGAATVEERLALRSIVGRLRSLTVNCDCSDDLEAKERCEIWKSIAQSALGLQELKLYSTGQYNTATVVDHFMQFGNYPSLQRLQIVGNAYDYIKCPLDHVHYELAIRFLGRHYDSLLEISLRDIVFTPYRDVALTVDEETRKALECILETCSLIRSRMVALQTFEMKITRADHYRMRESEEDDNYLDFDLEGLMDQLSLELKGKQWDFGDKLEDEDSIKKARLWISQHSAWN